MNILDGTVSAHVFALNESTERLTPARKRPCRSDVQTLPFPA